jgi:hypothetical protein
MALPQRLLSFLAGKNSEEACSCCNAASFTVHDSTCVGAYIDVGTVANSAKGSSAASTSDRQGAGSNVYHRSHDEL